ncbi:MAG: ABC transporter ATP-binding protein [Candidatus Omnitrophica bacterium]|nr:ABC transporter ATP-binding protein [Candidatus Omnitrophota bacterium]
MLEINNLTCGYGAKIIISAVSFQVNSGEFFGVIGPNGSGKSTLLRALSRVIKPMSGRITLNGRDTAEISARDFACQTAVVSQLVPVAPMTVEEFVLLGRIPHFNSLQFAETRQDIEVARQCMGITDTLRLKDRSIDQLSGGERQLAQIARALAQQPKLLLLDEPTAHLDITHQVMVMDLLKKLVREMGLTVVMVLHDLNLGSEYCDRMTLISEGRVYRTGTAQDVIAYQVIEKVYKTVVVVDKNPVSGQPHVLIVPEEVLRKKRSL